MSDCWVPTMALRPSQHHQPSGGGGGGGGGGGAAVLRHDGTLPLGSFGTGRKVAVFLDSRDRDYVNSPGASSFVVKLPEALHNVTNAVLVSAELPATYYAFSAARGTTGLRVTIGATTADVQIPDGTYTLEALRAALEAAITLAGMSATVAMDARTMKCSIAAANPAAQVAVDCTAAALGNDKKTDWGLGYYLGFPRDAVTAGTGSVTGAGVVRLDPEAYVLVDIDELNGVTETAMYADGGTRGAFAKIPLVQKNFGQFSVYDKTLVCNELRPPRARLDRLTVSLRYHDGTLVNLNGAEWSATIELTCTQTRV